MASPSPDRFDPCRAWLGIDRADLADPRRVLGLVPGETDPIVVLKAAETRLKTLKGLAAGQHHAAREALILQVEQAREKVLSQIASAGGSRGQGTPADAGGGFAMPPPPRRPVTPQSDGPATVVLEDPGQPGPAAAEAPIVRVRNRLPARRQGNAAIWVSLLAMVASVAAGTGFIWWQSRQEELRQSSRQQSAKRSADEGAATDDRRGAVAKPLPEDVAISSSPPPRPMRKPVAAQVPKPSPQTTAPAPTTAATVEPEAPAEAGMGADLPPADPIPPPMEDESGTETDADAEPMTDEPMTDEPMTDEPMTDEPPAGDDAKEEGIDSAVTEALAALRKGDFDTADALLASALEGGRNLPAKRRVSDWQTLAQYAREFADFREKAIASVQPGNEFDVNGKKVAVVEIDDKKFIYRFQGRNKSTPRNKIPSGIALAIVTTWFDERAANHLFLGAHYATKPEPDLAKARDHWERAEKGGINAEPLLRLLEDSVFQNGAPAAEPSDE